MLNCVLLGFEPKKSVERLLVSLLLAVFLAEGAVALIHMSATGDEPHYLGMGLYLMKNRRWDLVDAVLQPPLSYYLHSLPLLGLSIDDRLFEIPDINARGRAIMASYPDDRVLMLARAPVLILAAGLGLLVFLWGREAYGGAGGLLALFLYVFLPVVISNAVQITPDMCLTAFSVLTLYLFWRRRNPPGFVYCFWVGGALGLALLSKYSAVLTALAIAVLLAPGPALRRSDPGNRSYSWRLRHMALIFAAALLMVNAGYLFRGAFVPLGGNTFESALFQRLERTRVVRSIPVPLPEAYVKGLDMQYSVVEKGFPSFLLGEKAQRGWYHYYLAAFLLKTPAAFLLLLFLAAAKGRDRLQWVILVPVLIFVLYFSVFRLSRGIRYILPVYPLLCVWIGQLAGRAAKMSSGPVLRAGMLFLLIWHTAGAVSIAPHYQAYISEIGGGPENGVHLLFESDFDWGQEMKGLSAYLKEEKIQRIKLGCFSTADPAHYGVVFDPLPCESPPRPETGLIAVSATALQVYGCYDWLKSHEPIHKVGYTIFIYDIPPGE
jgi:hypothetical protein